MHSKTKVHDVVFECIKIYLSINLSNFHAFKNIKIHDEILGWFRTPKCIFFGGVEPGRHFFIRKVKLNIDSMNLMFLCWILSCD